MTGTKKTGEMTLQMKLMVIAIATIATAVLAMWAVWMARATAEKPDPAFVASVEKWSATQRPGVGYEPIAHHGNWPTCRTAIVDYTDGTKVKLVGVYDGTWTTTQTEAESVSLRSVKTEERCHVLARTGALPND